MSLLRVGFLLLLLVSISVLLLYISIEKQQMLLDSLCLEIVSYDLYLLEKGNYIPLDDETNNDRFEVGELGGIRGLIISTSQSYHILRASNVSLCHHARCDRQEAGGRMMGK